LLLVIQGKEFDVVETLSKPSLNDLFYLKVKTKSEEFPLGVSLKTLAAGLERMASFTNPMDFIDDAESLLSLRALIFLARRHAGERVTLDSANDVPLDEFSFVPEDGDEALFGASPDPQPALTDSAQGGAHRADPPTEYPTTSSETSPNGLASSPTTGPE
jgi:hypothetical protein